MLLLDFPVLAVIQLVFVGFSVLWFLRRNDEIPLVVSSLIFYVTAYRYWTVDQGLTNFVNLSYLGLHPITFEAALVSLGLITLGEFFLLSSYFLSQKETVPTAQVDPLIKPLLKKVRSKILLFALVSLPISVLIREFVLQQFRSGKSFAFQISAYLYLFPLLLTGVATLILLIWRFGALRGLWNQLIAVLVLFNVAQMTWGPGGRFRFIGWIITAGIIISSFYRPRIRLLFLTLSAVIGSGLFALAGASRRGVEGTVDAALTRFTVAEDANMLDGFSILMQAVPHQVPFRLGMVHLEILIRPIPRALWPEKPTGGTFLEAVGLVDPNTGATLGFSTTLFGDFYSEGGVIGIVLLSILYGFLLAKLLRWSLKLHPFLGVLARAILLAGLVPILRGGDLAGVWAWIGMAFWPCFVLMWWLHKRIKVLQQQALLCGPQLYMPIYSPGTGISQGYHRV